MFAQNAYLASKLAAQREEELRRNAQANMARRELRAGTKGIWRRPYQELARRVHLSKPWKRNESIGAFWPIFHRPGSVGGHH